MLTVPAGNDSGINNYFCPDYFWDINLTWYSPNPNFTTCFQQLILISVPCLIFSVICGINLILSCKQTVHIRLPWTALNISKLVLSAILFCLSAIQLGFSLDRKFSYLNVPDINIYTSAIRCATFVLIITVMIRNRDVGKTSSDLLVLFWLVMSLCGIILLRSTILRAFYKDFYPIEVYEYIPDLIYYPIIFCQFFLSLFVDKTAATPLEEKSPFDEASFLSSATYYWFNSLIIKGRKTLLTLDDFPALPRKMHADYLWRMFCPMWQREMQNYNSRVSARGDDKTNVKLPRLFWVLIKTFWPWMAFGFLFNAINVAFMMLPPLLLDCLLTFILSNEYAWKGYLFCVAMFLTDFIKRMAFTATLYISQGFALQVRTTLFSAIYRKSLRLSSESRKDNTTGKIVNFMSVDVERIYSFCVFISWIFAAPAKLILSIALLWMYLGPSVLSGIGMLCIMMVATAFVTRKINRLQDKQMEVKDSRLKILTEILNGIKILKLYVWEIPFMKKVADIREREVNLIRQFQILFGAFSFIWQSASFMVAIAIFTTYILIDTKHFLSPKIVFVSLNLLNILQNGVVQVPELFSDFIQMLVSLKRIAEYLSLEELTDDIGSSPDEGKVISVKDGVLSWDKKGEPTLKNISFNVPEGSLIAIVGPVGSGKSSILSAILGEMYRLSGSIDVKGQISYVPQQAWILNQTVKDNILFIKPMNKTNYNRVLECCCLKSDLEILPAGDKTEIGEKGVNLSGGQKQRVSLARAVYHDSDIYLLDDPLSAVDAHVGKHIFEQVIGNNGLLRDKTRVLVTHNIHILHKVDFIITMKDGAIQETGTYKELIGHDGFFAELIREHSNMKDNTDDFAIEENMVDSTEAAFKDNVPARLMQQRTISVDSKISETDGRLVDDEYMEVGEVKRETYLKYLRSLSWKFVIIILAGYLGQQIFEIGGNFWLSSWSSDPAPVNGTQDIALRNERISVYAAYCFTQSVFLLAACIVLAIATARASKTVHFMLLESVMKARMMFFDTTPTGRILNRFGRDMDDIDTGIPMTLDGFLYCLVATLGTFCVIGINTPLFIPFLIPLGLIFYYVQRLYIITSRQLKRYSSTTCSPLYSHLSESFQGAPSINAYKVSSHFIQKVETKVDTNCLCNFLWITSTRWLDMQMIWLGDIIIFVTAVLAVASRHHLAASLVGLSVTYALSVTDVIRWVVRSGTDLENKSVSMERISEYSTLQSEAPWEIPDETPPSSWPQFGSITFKNYSTRYREGLNLVLDELNLHISQNEKVGIVGRTGAGKSSVTLALFRIIEPVSGTIIIDDVDVGAIGLHDLRSELTIIPQDPILFTGPLRVNLDPNEVYTDDELWSSLDHANLKTFVASLPEGLVHTVAEGGSNLSVGQRQLICLARALLKKTKVLILDEATAAVDVETDRLIQNTIRTEFKDHTIITIAHRLNTIVDYDKVVIMESGKISEVGRPSELMEDENSQFHKMAKDAGIL